MDLASAKAEIRHVFGDTPITEASIGAAPPDILVKLSDIILFFDQYSSPSPPLIQKYIVGSLIERFSSGYMLWLCVFLPFCIFVLEIAIYNAG